MVLKASVDNTCNQDYSVSTGTQMNKRKSGPRTKKSSTEPAQPDVDKRPEGWLWQLGKLSKMTNAEMDEWSSEGDRVQWFRAEAEMQCWQEHFIKMQQAWTEFGARSSERPGYQAYGNQKAAMYQRRAQQVQNLVAAAGYTELDITREIPTLQAAAWVMWQCWMNRLI
ncbi:hypothetical protein B0H10DRAFT_2196499 [Mycena sp. CBHHK59/15]|nr:hypothetical protein B0H10DRAFT_2196499 [Mycena sp. CBHHK59/15]